MDRQGPTIEEILNNPATSFWLKEALQKAMQRDPVDAANDAALLSSLLDTHVNDVLLAGAVLAKEDSSNNGNMSISP